MKEAHQYLDFINIMTYDFFTGGSKYTGHHANLYNSEFNKKSPKSAEIEVENHLKAGIPASKLVLGVPFYGRWWTKVHPKNNGLYQLSNGITGSYSYSAIADSIKNNNFKSYWDDICKNFLIYGERRILFLLPMIILDLVQIKADFVKKKQLGGIMFWQFNADNGTLLNEIYENLEK